MIGRFSTLPPGSSPPLLDPSLVGLPRVRYFHCPGLIFSFVRGIRYSRCPPLFNFFPSPTEKLVTLCPLPFPTLTLNFFLYPPGVVMLAEPDHSFHFFTRGRPLNACGVPLPGHPSEGRLVASFTFYLRPGIFVSTKVAIPSPSLPTPLFQGGFAEAIQFEVMIQPLSNFFRLWPLM